MRCPKCSYISFDLVESCTKCGKDISRTAEELNGTIADVEPPAFLRFDIAAREAEAVGGEEVFAGEEEEMMDLDLEEGEAMVDFSIDDETAAAPDREFDVSLEEAGGVSEVEILDISDLAPEEELPAEIPVEDFAFGAGPAEKAELGAQYEAKELEDLEVEGIDLEASTVPKSGKVMPSVKTGTALDDFDIDLGDLISPKEEKTS